MRLLFPPLRGLLLAALPVALLVASNAHAVPSFARQTGQNCVACHAGGQFPELTPYGRMFKLTGYTIGQRTLPLSVMAVVNANKVKVDDPADKTTTGALTFATASVFLAGKISDNIGAFTQVTFDTTPNIGTFSGRSHPDNMDIRYADRLIDDNSDLIYGLMLNNNPGVQDVFHSVPAWGPATVPGSTGAGAGAAPILDGGLGQQAAGIGAYAYWNRTLYAEITGYKTGDGVFSILTHGNGGQTYIKGTNPYVRLALTKEWGPHNVMLGLTHFDVRQYSDQTDLTSPTDHYRDNGIDAQYQYLLDPYTVTATVARIHENIDYAAGNSDTVNSLRAKASFTYQAKYGATLSYFSLTNTLGEESKGWTPEVFWTPLQNVRLGLQYTLFNKDQAGANPNARDNNTLFFYVWGAY
ncbi:MAG: cytochrome C [Betaproteobacteria bacterium]|nr:cytochrome C [Betaproteobacteria bacterium]